MDIRALDYKLIFQLSQIRSKKIQQSYMKHIRSGEKKQTKKVGKSIQNENSLSKKWIQFMKLHGTHTYSLKCTKKFIQLPKIQKQSQISIKNCNSSQSTRVIQIQTIDPIENSIDSEIRIQKGQENIFQAPNPQQEEEKDFIESINDQILRRTHIQSQNNVQPEKLSRTSQEKRKKSKNVMQVPQQLQKIQERQYKQSIERFKNKIKREISQLSLNILDGLGKTEVKSILYEKFVASERQSLHKQYAHSKKSSKLKFKTINHNLRKSSDCINENFIPNNFLKVLPQKNQYKGSERMKNSLTSACRKRIKKLLQVKIDCGQNSKLSEVLPSIR